MTQQRSFKATANAEYTFEGVLPDLDLVMVKDGHYHILSGHQSFRVEVIEMDFDTKTFTIKVNGGAYKVQLEDEYDQLVQRLGLAAVSKEAVKEIRAPMPGMVLSIAVEAGQEVKKGDSLVILEAMKMENVLKCPGDGRIKSINVRQGEAVEKNYLLLEME
ncbi:MAG: acetyl-CoA carboxylase biotin carboxyl carrier protein subunit [Phaeodactylibacter sp.]|nr:acetyl-CoA carboxylase biotin carboxyl carrier protein subunit [Phaeodactylibacter sp.]MCB9273814.1 acetyl-CoA carboxylase biotin carboxyl carrier protein subunit [Lewinellaceae bacterium]